MVVVNGVEYLQGPVGKLGSMPKDWKHQGSVGFGNQSLYKDSNSNLWLVWVPLDSQWQHYQALRTQAQLLRGWA